MTDTATQANFKLGIYVASYWKNSAARVNGYWVSLRDIFAGARRFHQDKAQSSKEEQ